MASLMKSLLKTYSLSSSTTSTHLKSITFISTRSYAKVSSKEKELKEKEKELKEKEKEKEHEKEKDNKEIFPEVDAEATNFPFPTSGISRPLSDILKELNKRVPDSLIKVRTEDGFSMKYVPWHIVNRIMNLHAPEWSGEVRDITYSTDGKSVSVIYRVTLYGTDAEIFRESTGTASVDDTSYGDPVQKAEAMAFRRACARLGLGLHLYHDDMS